MYSYKIYIFQIYSDNALVYTHAHSFIWTYTRKHEHLLSYTYIHIPALKYTYTKIYLYTNT